ncbi:MAG: CBS domain-containing protein [Sedimentisphaerales bacterium]|jgi:magnesium transporter
MTSKLKEHNLHEPVSMHMRKDFVSLRQDETVGQAVKTLRKHDVTNEILYLYVTDEQGRLVGVVPVRSILVSEPDTKISFIMVRNPVTVAETQTVLKACELFAEHRFLALPVVDDEKRIVGVIDINFFTNEVVGIAHQRHLDNIFQLIGVHVSLGKAMHSWSSFKGRFPWLLCNITSGIICAFIASRYELLIKEVAVLAMFITVVLAIAESVSIQSMTLTLQVFLQEQVSWRRILTGIRKEILVSTMIGAGAGTVVGIAAFLWKGHLLQGVAVGISIWLAVIVACLLGVIVPSAIRRFRVDPKIAAGPIVLATTDITTLLFYFSTAGWLLS